MVTQKDINELSYKIIGSAMEVHKIIGRGLVASVYHQCLKEELRLRNINFVSELKVFANYKGNNLDCDFRCDLLIENLIVVELKAVNEMHPIFDSKLLTYMNLLKSPKGMLINFNSYNIFKKRKKTFVNEYFKALPID